MFHQRPQQQQQQRCYDYEDTVLPSALVSHTEFERNGKERRMGGWLTNDKAPMALREWPRIPGEGAGSRRHYHNSHSSPSSPPPHSHLLFLLFLLPLLPPPSPHTRGHTTENTLSTPTQTYTYSSSQSYSNTISTSTVEWVFI